MVLPITASMKGYVPTAEQIRAKSQGSMVNCYARDPAQKYPARPWRIHRKQVIITTNENMLRDMISHVRVLVDFPNLNYVLAADLNKIGEDIMSMDPHCSETQAILDDEDIMSALERSDRQYKEGRAKSLHDLIKDLGFDVDALRD